MKKSLTKPIFNSETFETQVSQVVGTHSSVTIRQKELMNINEGKINEILHHHCVQKGAIFYALEFLLLLIFSNSFSSIFFLARLCLLAANLS